MFFFLFHGTPFAPKIVCSKTIGHRFVGGPPERRVVAVLGGNSRRFGDS